MEIFIILVYFILFLIAFFLSVSGIKFFITMWEFKKSKKDDSKDSNFKRFD